MRVLAWIAPVLAAGTVAVFAASPVPPDAVPGRERDRFTTSPVERFMQPGPYVTAPVPSPPRTKCAMPRRANQRTRRVKVC
jgi:hypothetical protein